MEVSADDVKGIGVERVVLGPAASCDINCINQLTHLNADKPWSVGRIRAPAPKSHSPRSLHPPLLARSRCWHSERVGPSRVSHIGLVAWQVLRVCLRVHPVCF
jgi:hypothetical protein